MAQSDSLHLFHLYLPGGRPSFFHDLTGAIHTPERIAHNELRAYYGRDPDPPEVAEFRKELHHTIAHAVRRECADAGFPLRFVLSSAAFLAGFLILSLFFRFTPLPIKLVTAVLTGMATYLFILRKKCGGEGVKDRVEGLCGRLDAVVFRESSFIGAVEEYLDSLANMPTDQMMSHAIHGDKRLPSDSELGPPLCRYIEQRRRSRIPERLYRKLLRAKRLSDRDWVSLQSRCDADYFPPELLALLLYFKLHHNYSDITCSSKRIDSSSR